MPFFEHRALGWNPLLEEKHWQSLASMQQQMCGADGDPLPDVVDPPLDVNDQLSFSSCEGNAVDKATEADHFFQTGTVVNLSARFAYLTSKMVDGTLESGDNGASISGGGIASQKYGCCLEETFPYWSRGDSYTTEIPQVAFEQAKDHRIQAYCSIPNWDAGMKLIGTGQGAFTFGINWYESLANYKTDDPNHVITKVGGRSLGGHALCTPSYVTMAGQKIPNPYNSHGTGWGYKGRFKIDPDLLFRLIREGGFSACGFTGLEAFTKRKIKTFSGEFGV